MELFLPLFFHEAVIRRKLSIGRVTELLSENPARRLQLWPQKGSLTIGADADIVIFDPDRRWRVDEARLVTPAGWSPYHGRDVVVQFKARATLKFENFLKSRHIFLVEGKIIIWVRL